MASFLPEAQYEALIHAVKQQFENPPVSDVCVGSCSMLSCLLTGGVCFCPILYLKRKVDAFNKEASAAIATAVVQTGCSAKLDKVQIVSAFGGYWVDQNGLQLLLTSGKSTRTGGPPLGYNIVVNLAAPPPYWSPSQGTQQITEALQMRN
jgi:hypothetical protein